MPYCKEEGAKIQSVDMQSKRRHTPKAVGLILVHCLTTAIVEVDYFCNICFASAGLKINTKHTSQISIG